MNATYKRSSNANGGQLAIRRIGHADFGRPKGRVRFRTSTAAEKEKAASAPVGLSAAKRQNGILQGRHTGEAQRCGRGIEPAILQDKR